MSCSSVTRAEMPHASRAPRAVTRNHLGLRNPLASHRSTAESPPSGIRLCSPTATWTSRRSPSRGSPGGVGCCQVLRRQLSDEPSQPKPHRQPLPGRGRVDQVDDERREFLQRRNGPRRREPYIAGSECRVPRIGANGQNRDADSCAASFRSCGHRIVATLSRLSTTAAPRPRRWAEPVPDHPDRAVRSLGAIACLAGGTAVDSMRRIVPATSDRSAPGPRVHHEDMVPARRLARTATDLQFWRAHSGPRRIGQATVAPALGDANSRGMCKASFS